MGGRGGNIVFVLYVILSETLTLPITSEEYICTRVLIFCISVPCGKTSK
jgi:hypothetical protein